MSYAKFLKDRCHRGKQVLSSGLRAIFFDDIEKLKYESFFICESFYCELKKMQPTRNGRQGSGNLRSFRACLGEGRYENVLRCSSVP